ncbi:hypothetical protein, variant 2 [Aphanomyces astaci]|uniref:Vacuolar protein sorting-associated protein 54 N-terminal domain-containing protein n=1 Tax=Aphanomyces astaci TaxID=112090 RepID=W4GGF5_APHAT|nr:hypothetical protein, variant 2 [Aphanomyces astaci]ETV78760.1 hypothetical protein, variant 2 [Aphanomyces astaci]|eukprot:XP_009831479.1 hypothetical protein, variant 2 [Aphanomyces astaci]
MHRQTAMGSPSSPEKSPERMDPSSAMASEGLSLDALGSEDSVLNNLDPRFFTQHFDPVQHMLESLPTNPFALIDHLQSEIGAMDIAKDVVTSKLAEEIQRNYHTFIQGMNHVQEVDLDLAQALIQVKNGRRLLAIHKKDLVMSHLELVKLRRNRDRVHTIVDHASSILDCFKHEQDMVAAVHDKAFERAVRVCAALRHRATHLHQFSVLKQCIQRMHLALPELRQHFHSALGDLLVSFDGHVYDELLRALAALDAHLSSSSPSKGTPPTGRSPMRAVVGTDDVVRVVVAAMDELTRGAVANLLDTTSTGASIAMVVDAVLNVYELLASLLHNLDLFEQWHEKRGERDDAAAADAFRQVRPLMWESLQRRMGDAWTRLTWPNDTKVEHVVGLTHATETLVAMGMDFAKTSSTDMIQGNTLQSAFVGTVLVFLTELLHDNMELMRMMMDTEKWERLSVDTANNIWRLLESRSGFTLTQPIPPCPSSSSPRTPTAWWNPFQGGAARSRYINVPSMEKFVATCGPTCEADDQAPTHQMNVNATPDEQELFGSTHVVTWSTYSGFLRYATACVASTSSGCTRWRGCAPICMHTSWPCSSSTCTQSSDDAAPMPASAASWRARRPQTWHATTSATGSSSRTSRTTRRIICLPTVHQTTTPLCAASWPSNPLRFNGTCCRRSSLLTTNSVTTCWRWSCTKRGRTCTRVSCPKPFMRRASRA